MSGLIQRLQDRSAGSLSATPSSDVAKVTSAARTLSPMADHDQRLQDPGFRNLIGMLPSSPYQTAPEAMAEQPAIPTMTARRPIRREDFKRPAARPPKATTTEVPETSAMADATTHQQAVAYDPIAALRRGVTETLPVSPSQVLAVTAPQQTSTQATQSAPADHVQPEAQLKHPVTAREAPTTPSDEPSQPPISERLPTDPINIDALPATPTPPTRPTTDRPVRISKPELPETNAVAATNSAVQSNPVELQLAQPVMPKPAVSPASLIDMAPQISKPAAERIIERIVREVESPTVSEQQRTASRVTANSVSKIGALPQRRRAHTLFGLRRG